ncbi:MAG: hypothetical protein LC623_00120 [Halobacteriales archaeon]|nr:hypothetical protein [Halobacteriales archaeon]
MATKRAAKKASKTTSRKATGRSTSRTAASRKASPKKAAAPAARKIRPGAITHTELASSDPTATKQWAEKTLGWKFGDSMPTPNGPYHMWRFGENMGGGIRANNPPETPGTVPYVEVSDINASYQKALRNGATEMLPPQEIQGGMGWIAIVQAPGGPAVGLWGTK